MKIIHACCLGFSLQKQSPLHYKFSYVLYLSYSTFYTHFKSNLSCLNLDVTLCNKFFSLNQDFSFISIGNMKYFQVQINMKNSFAFYLSDYFTVQICIFRHYTFPSRIKKLFRACEFHYVGFGIRRSVLNTFCSQTYRHYLQMKHSYIKHSVSLC